ncbi:MAG: hypothetical protein HY718_08020, partial [Planctomycetes bacterium]|nr:hypothetical protein [Planctomycetota bacterium]
NCGPPPAVIGGVPTGWSTDTNMSREGNAPLPPSCPSPAGGHYGTMSSGEGGTLRAWQTIQAQQGGSYTFSGYFAGSADCTIALLNGDENGTVLNSTAVFTGGDGGTWHQASVTATATSSVMTVMWRIDNATPEGPGGHADGLQLSSNCHTVWADADDDGDVDMIDFAEWQRCYSPVVDLPAEPGYCACFDRAAPFGRIDDVDLTPFLNCVSGSAIPVASCP